MEVLSADFLVVRFVLFGLPDSSVDFSTGVVVFLEVVFRRGRFGFWISFSVESAAESSAPMGLSDEAEVVLFAFLGLSESETYGLVLVVFDVLG